MTEPRDIEKRSLEAHVELCAERYNNLDFKINDLNEKIDSVSNTVEKVHDMVKCLDKSHNDRLVNWAVGVIGVLVSVIGWLVVNYILK